jgi:3'-phosphoadenosine 5'-phosphosulfate sulfotransferase (PAPS reductase)/FAD synthetase
VNLVVFASYGNDSIALLSLLAQLDKDAEVTVVYSDTGWAAPWWEERVDQGEAFARSKGFTPVRIESEGFVPLAIRKKGFPRNQLQFCTQELKIFPAMAWLAEHDPDCEAVCTVGVRREESKSRSQWPEWVEESDKHGGRSLWSPLVRVKEAERDALIVEAGFEVLPHRSMECYPCIQANKADLRLLDEERIAHIEKIESEMGVSAKTGKPKTLFRPYRHMGAVGIREVVKWANSGRGEYEPPSSSGCDSGFCGG